MTIAYKTEKAVREGVERPWQAIDTSEINGEDLPDLVELCGSEQAAALELARAINRTCYNAETSPASKSSVEARQVKRAVDGITDTDKRREVALAIAKLIAEATA